MLICHDNNVTRKLVVEQGEAYIHQYYDTLMRCECIICTEKFTVCKNLSSSVISALPCGHCFHKVCVSRWMVESKTCPQCRQKCRSNKVIDQLYFCATSDESMIEVPDESELLLHKIEEKTNDIARLSDTNQQLNKDLCLVTNHLQISHSLSGDLTRKNKSMQCELRRLQLQERNYDTSNREVKRLQTIVSQLADVGTIIENSKEDIASYLGNKDRDQLATMCGVLKRELTSKRQETKKLRSRIHEINVGMQRELRAKNMENTELSEEIDSVKLNLVATERDNASLQKKITKLQDNFSTPLSKGVARRVMLESPMPSSLTVDSKENLNGSVDMQFSDTPKHNLRNKTYSGYYRRLLGN